MTRKHLAISSIVIAGLMTAAAVAVGTSLPADVMLPTHWGMNGQADGFSDKWSALMMPVALVVGASLLLYFIPLMEPRKGGLERSRGLYLASWAGMLLISCVVELTVIGAALEWPVEPSTFIFTGVGALFVLLGNQLAKSRSMYMIGIRTPWTLASEEVWVKTHRLAGKLMFGGGIALIVIAFLPLSRDIVGMVVLPILAIVVAVPLAYSFILWRREQGSDRTQT